MCHMAAAAWRNMYFTPSLSSELVCILPPLHTVEISFWDDVTVAGRVKTADLYWNVLQQMFTDVVGSVGVEVGGWSSSPLPWQWTDRQRCGLHHIWRAPHGLTDTQTRGQDPRCSHTHTPQVFTMMVNMTICYKTRSKIHKSMFWCLNNPELHRGYSLYISSVTFLTTD